MLTLALYCLFLFHKYLAHNTLNKKPVSVLMVMVMVWVYGVSLPVRTVAANAILAKVVSKKEDMEILIVMGVLALLLDMVISLLFHMFLQVSLPVPDLLPFALADPKLQYYTECILYLYCVVVAFPLGFTPSTYVFAVLTVLALGAYFKFNTYYMVAANHMAKLR